MSNVISLPPQLTHSLPRSFFDRNYLLTDINGVAYFDTSQACDLLEITADNWHQRMARRASSGDDLTYLQDRSAFSRVYSIPTSYPSGSKQVNFYHPKLVLEEAVTIRDPVKIGT